MLQDRVIYKNQFAMMAFISMIVFKMAMLPKYMSISSGNDSWITVGLMMLAEIMMMCIVFYITTKVDIVAECPRWLMIPLMILTFMMTNIRGIVLFSSLLDYTTTTLFDQNRYTFIIIIFAPVLAYFVYNGGNVLARLAELIFYASVFILICMVALARIDIDWLNILPILSDGGVGMAKGIYRHFMWFGDFIPLLFFRVVDNKQKFLNKFSFPLCLAGAFVFVVMFYIVFIGVYGEAGGSINFAFNTLAIFNRISEVLGTTNFVSIIAWLFMALVQLSLLLYAATVSLAYFVKKWWLSLTVNVIGVMMTVLLWVQNVDKAYIFATSWLSYFVGAAQYLAPIVLLIYVIARDKKLKREGNDNDTAIIDVNDNIGEDSYAKE